MPAPSGKKQAERTKGNTRPASSSQAAQLLCTSNISGGFIGFGSLIGTPGYVPVAQNLDDVDTNLDADFRLVLRKLVKKDVTTKIKALQEFSEFCRSKDIEDVKNVIPFWPRMYNKCALDIDHRVRDATHQAMMNLVSRVKKHIAPSLKALMGTWMLGLCDTYPSVASTAEQSFQTAFPPAKQIEAITFCKKEISQYLIDNLTNQTSQTLSDSVNAEEDEMENKYNRVMTSSLLGLRKLISTILRKEVLELVPDFRKLLNDARFWKHTKSSVLSVKAGTYSLLACVCQILPEICLEFCKKVTSVFLHNLDEKEPVLCVPLWEGILSLVKFIPECWSCVNVEKAFRPKLFSLLENGLNGNASIVAENILPFLSKIPSRQMGDENKFFMEFFNSIKRGIENKCLLNVGSECSAMVQMYVECCNYVAKNSQEEILVNFIVNEHLLPLTKSFLFDKGGKLEKTSFPSHLNSVMNSFEKSGNGILRISSDMFWEEITICVTEKISTLINDSGFMTRLVDFAKRLFYPETVKKMLTQKVKFSQITTTCMQHEDRKVDESELCEGALNFMKGITIQCFRAAQRDNTEALHAFVELVELDSSESLIAVVLEEDKIPEDKVTQHFLSQVCFPWLRKMPQKGNSTKDSEKLVNLICVLLKKLERKDLFCVLNTVCEIIHQREIFFHFLKKLILLSSERNDIRDWIQNQAFTDKVLVITSEVCQLNKDYLEESSFQCGWDIISVVISSEKGKTFSSSLTLGILKQLHTIVSILANCEEEDKFEIYLKCILHAGRSFFENAKEHLFLPSAYDFLLGLIHIFLKDSRLISDSTKQDLEEICLRGIDSILNFTTAQEYNDSFLQFVPQLIKGQLLFTTPTELQVFFEKINNIIEVVQNVGSVNGEHKNENPLWKIFLEDMYTEIDDFLSSEMMEASLLKNDYTYLELSQVGNSVFNVKERMLAAVFNMKLMEKHILQKTSNTQQSFVLSTKEINVFCSCIHVLAINNFQIELNPKKFFSPFFHEINCILENLVKEMIRSASLDERNKLASCLLDRCEYNMDKHWTYALRHFIVLITDQDHTLAPGAESAISMNRIIEKYCDHMNIAKVQILQAIVPSFTYLENVTMSEIMVSLMISCSEESRLDISGGLGALAALNRTLPYIAKVGTCEHYIKITKSVLQHLLKVKIESTETFLFEGNLKDSSMKMVVFNAEMMKFFGSVIASIPQELTHEEWDFILCSLVSFMQTASENMEHLFSSLNTQLFLHNVCLFLGDTAKTLEAFEPEAQILADLKTEWLQFFSEGCYSLLQPIFLQFIGKLEDREWDCRFSLLASSMGYALSYCPKQHIIENKFPTLLVAGDSSSLPENVQSLLNHLTPLLLHKCRYIQLTAFNMLYIGYQDISMLDSTGEREKDDLTTDMTRQLPDILLKSLNVCNIAMDITVAELDIDECAYPAEGSEQYQFSLAYLLIWKLILRLVKCTSSEQRQEYAESLKKLKLVQQFMDSLFRLMPDNPPAALGKTDLNLFTCSTRKLVFDNSHGHEIQLMACSVYYESLQIIPALTRQWWLDQDRKMAAYIDKFTNKYVSGILSREEVLSISRSEESLENLTIRTRVTTGEVIVIYALEEVSTEMIISLPNNYPLGNISVQCEKRIGVSAAQWDKWILQLQIFLQHQNGSLFDGLRIWKKNIEKRFEGVEDCMICFSVLHGTNFRLPRLQCKTCKKKFHSACLYKWFQTSNNSTCPLCRNLF